MKEVPSSEQPVKGLLGTLPFVVACKRCRSVSPRVCACPRFETGCGMLARSEVGSRQPWNPALMSARRRYQDISWRRVKIGGVLEEETRQRTALVKQILMQWKAVEGSRSSMLLDLVGLDAAAGFKFCLAFGQLCYSPPSISSEAVWSQDGTPLPAGHLFRNYAKDLVGLASC